MDKYGNMIVSGKASGSKFGTPETVTGVWVRPGALDTLTIQVQSRPDEQQFGLDTLVTLTLTPDILRDLAEALGDVADAMRDGLKTGEVVVFDKSI